LGVVLIEIWYWESLASLSRVSGRTRTSDEWIAEFFVAEEFAHMLAEVAGANYGTAVKCCVLGFGHKETQLDREDFKNEVYKRIVCPLEQNLKNLCGESDLEKICSA